MVIFQLAALATYAQKGDTISIRPEYLRLRNLNYGDQMYLEYSKKSKDAPARSIGVMKINMKKQNDEIVVTQQIDKDTVLHIAEARFDPKNFSTLFHQEFWKGLSYTSKFDFVNRRVSFEGKIADSVKASKIKDFNESFSKYNLNWHADLVIFSLLPYKENRVFKINFYHPGQQPREVYYRVEGSEQLASPSGKIDCWLMTVKYNGPIPDKQKFWISKKTNEVLKEEEEYGGRYLYKLKLAVSEKD